MTVNQLSKRSGIAPHVVRYYSRIGLLTTTRHPENDSRSVCIVTSSESAHQGARYGDAQTLNPWNLTLAPLVHARRYRTSALHPCYPGSRFAFEKKGASPIESVVEARIEA
ncbi:MerR family DNA-binding transcriptional regulator [Sulfuricaulis sp.]|uniref:MerR family DNA-binding transcriptional regulator n=1 Tax=Sulfuricaulis sp. TaxID=2003553 RepID=UPI00345DB0E2